MKRDSLAKIGIALSAELWCIDIKESGRDNVTLPKASAWCLVLGVFSLELSTSLGLQAVQ